MEEKREIVYQVSNFADSATAAEILQTWSRGDILRVLSAEIGTERKYTGLTKSKIIEHLLQIVYAKKSLQSETASASEVMPWLENDERTPKRQRKSDHPNRLSIPGMPMYCKNSACKAMFIDLATFCKRCSCCICRQYDDNKDPSLWLICNSDPPFHGTSCGASCHLECALQHENSGISNDRLDKGLDGSFCCVSCGKVNDLLGSWRKQLVVARDTRRVDVLCYRLSLGQKILAGTKHYKNLCQVVDEAVMNLEKEIGPLIDVPIKGRGIVNRLSSGPEVQRLCATAVESLDLMLSQRVHDMPDCISLASKLVMFDDIKASSVKVVLNDWDAGNIVAYKLWLRTADDKDYPAEPIRRLFPPNPKFLLAGLIPATTYFLKVVTLDKDDGTVFCEFQFTTGSHQVERNQINNPPCYRPVKDETNRRENSHPIIGNDNTNKEETENGDASDSQTAGETSTGVLTGSKCAPCVDSSETVLQIAKNKPSKERTGEECSEGKEFERYVKVIRWLECDGHIDTSFRQDFLTWYSLRATPHEIRIMKIFVNTFREDPESLAAQLVDTFSDLISDKKCCIVPSGFCLKLWH